MIYLPDIRKRATSSHQQGDVGFQIRKWLISTLSLVQKIPMLVIDKTVKVALPKQFHFSNNICAYLYDQLTEILVDKHYAEMHSTAIEFGEDEKLKKLLIDEKVHAIDALHQTQKETELEIILAKHIVMSLISDMVNFIYESIKVAQKGKMSVAFALLRKPFTDQLLILEQILIDRKDFINRFFYIGNPDEYDPSSNKLQRAVIIERAVEKLNLLFSLNHELVYELRYDKTCKWGINGVSNQALHIVTNDKRYKTAKQDLNFTFRVEGETENYWEQYYCILPMLLNHTAAIVDKIVFELIKDEEGVRGSKELKRFLAILMTYNSKEESKSMYKLLQQIFISTCSICCHLNKFNKSDFHMFFYESRFFCKKCFNPIKIEISAINNFSDAFRKHPETV